MTQVNVTNAAIDNALENAEYRHMQAVSTLQEETAKLIEKLNKMVMQIAEGHRVYDNPLTHSHVKEITEAFSRINWARDEKLEIKKIAKALKVETDTEIDA